MDWTREDAVRIANEKAQIYLPHQARSAMIDLRDSLHGFGFGAGAAPPPRLCPWLENPYGPVSLWDIMIQFSGRILFASGCTIESLKSDCFFKTGLGELPLPDVFISGPIGEETIARALSSLLAIKDHCDLLGMPVSAETAKELHESLKNKHLSYHYLQSALEQLRGLIDKEIKSKVFFYVTPERMRFCPTRQTVHVFGDAVADAFPTASFDIAEAGRCLSLSRATAGVFHLMRVLEIGLGVLGKVFGVSLAHTNWGPAIGEIEKAVRGMHIDPTWKALPDCKEQQEFYSQAASHFGILKDAWRNYTAHARGVYTEESAARIFDNVGDFMKKLAEKLHE